MVSDYNSYRISYYDAYLMVILWLIIREIYYFWFLWWPKSSIVDNNIFVDVMTLTFKGCDATSTNNGITTYDMTITNDETVIIITYNDESHAIFDD